MVTAIQALSQTEQMDQRFFTPSTAYSPAIARWVWMLNEAEHRGQIVEIRAQAG